MASNFYNSIIVDFAIKLLYILVELINENIYPFFKNTIISMSDLIFLQFGLYCLNVWWFQKMQI